MIMRTKTRQRGQAALVVTVAALKTARPPLRGDGRESKVLKSEKLSPGIAKIRKREGLRRVSEGLKNSEERIIHVNSALRAIRNVNQLIVHEKNRERLIRKSCRLLVEARSYTNVWILLVDKDQNFVSAASAGAEEKLSFLMEELKQGKYPPCVHKVLGQEQPLAVYDDVSRQCKGCSLADSHSHRSAFMGRLEYEGKVYGIIAVHILPELASNLEEQSLFRELAGDIAYALASIEREEERERLYEELQSSDEQYRDLFDSASDLIQSVASDGCLLYTNKAWRDMLGYSEKEIANLKIWDIISPESMDHCMGLFKRVMAGEHVSDIETVFVAKDGNLIAVEGNAHCRFAEGKPVSTQGFFRDVTKRKRAEEALRQSEVRYRTILEEMEEGYFEVDVHGNFTVINDATCRVLGYPREEIIGVNYRVFVTEEYVDAVYQAFNQIYQTGTPIQQFTWEVLGKDGGRRFIEASLSRLQDQEGRLIGFRGVGRDITERKRAEESLRQSEERYRALFNSKLDGMCVMDETMKVLLVNQAAVDIFGFDSIDEALGANPFDFIPVEERERVLDIVKKDMFENDLRQVNEFRLTNKSGKDIWVGAIGTLTEYQGKLAGLISFRDITDRKMAEDKVKKLYSLQMAIRYINESLLKVDDEPALFEQVCHFLTDVEFIKFCWICLADKGSRELKPVAYSGFEDGYLSSLKIRLGSSTYKSGCMGIAIKTRQPCAVADIENDPKFTLRREAALKRGYASSLAVPLIHDNEVIGALGVYSGSKGAFGDAEIDFLAEAAADVALGIRTLRLRRELQQSLDSLGKALEGTVSALASVAEVRDPYTAGHQQRVTRLAVAIATEMGLPREQIEGIHVAGTLHDVGKLYIPAEILSKPGKLNEVEFNMVKMHSQAGYDILKTVEFPWPVAQIVLQHHERLDGSGYPQGLSGEDILLESKILAVADVVEAMASHRPYRPSLGMGQALDEISKKSGILYDPKVVDACFRLFYEKEFKLD
jgi:PAS domain S-box-containing protein